MLVVAATCRCSCTELLKHCSGTVVSRQRTGKVLYSVLTLHFSIDFLTEKDETVPKPFGCQML